MPAPRRAEPLLPAAPAPAESAYAAPEAIASPVHALQAAIGQAWQPAPILAAERKTICAGKLALIAALGLAAWVPVAAAATALLA